MKLFARSLSSMTTFEFRSKLISTPWVKRANFIRYSKRDYESSGPVRYIPKKLSKVEKNNTSLPTKKLERAEFENLQGSASSWKRFPQRKPSLSSESDNETDNFFEKRLDIEENQSSFPEKKLERAEFENFTDSVSLQRMFPPRKPCLLSEPNIETDTKPDNLVKKRSNIKENLTFFLTKKLDRAEFQNFRGLVSSERRFPLRKPSLAPESNIRTDNLFEDARESVKLEKEEDSKSGFEDITGENEFLSVKELCEEDAKLAGRAKEDAEKFAIQALARRAITAAELRKKLNGKGFSPNVIDQVVVDFRSRGFINDYLYAETFSQSRWSTSTWGPRRIKQCVESYEDSVRACVESYEALNQKGVSKADAEKATKHVFEGDDSCDDHETTLGMSKEAVDHLFVQASKQWLRGQDVTYDKRKARIVRWLQYRGFNWGVTSFIVKKLESNHRP